MLSELHIRDFAIIDELHLSLPSGFIVLTGETGAGKSIIIDAVGLVLGGRADPTVVRAGADRALVEAVFRLDPAHQAALHPILEREGLEGDEPDLLILSREVRAEGRSICRVNGRAVTLAVLREVAEGLVDIHGQSEHLSLLRVREHVHLLDRFAGLNGLRARVADLVARVRAVRRERASLEQDEQERARRIDLLQYQIAEIEAAALRPGEEEELADERLRLANAEQLSLLLADALRALDEGGEEGRPATDQLGHALRALEGLARIDGSLAPRLQEAEELLYRLQDLADGLREYRHRVEFNPRRLAEVEERLDLIRRLKRKYGATVAEVLEYARRAAAELETITHSEERIAELAAQEAQLLDELARVALELSARRREAARHLAEGIEAELQDLRMAGARFAVDFRWTADPEGVPLTPKDVAAAGIDAGDFPLPARVGFDATGIDRVEFLVSPNPGEPLKPLTKIASGGETSRLMLALKAVLSRVDETPTLIFDEIDQGIGGRVGAMVGEKLWRLTAPSGGEIAHQVLCVTHLPQLAGFGDAHLRVEKIPLEGRTVTRVTVLEGPARVEELAQMLGASGESAYRSAEEILEEAGSRKQEAGGKRQEARSRKQEAGSRKQEAGGRRQEARGKKQEARSKKQEAGGRRQEAGSRRQEARGKRQEARSKRQEARSKKQEVGGRSRRQEAGGRRQEARGKRQEAGSKKQEAGSGKLVANNRIYPITVSTHSCLLAFLQSCILAVLHSCLLCALCVSAVSPYHCPDGIRNTQHATRNTEYVPCPNPLPSSSPAACW